MDNGITESQTAQASTDTLTEKPTHAAKRPGAVAKVFSFVGNVFFVCLLLTMVLLVFAMVQSRLSGEAPRVAGYEMYIVIGGSMSPTFEAGSLAFLRPVDPETIEVGDVITYRGHTGDSTLTTHRVVAVHREDGQLSFTTRGDANDVDDAVPVQAESVLGTVQFTIPYAGYLMNFAQTPKGLLALVIVPGVLVIIFELRNLLRYAAEAEAEKKAREKAQAGASDNA